MHWEKFHILRLFEIYLLLKNEHNKLFKIPECENIQGFCVLSDIYNSNKDSFNELKMNILEYLKNNDNESKWNNFFNLEDDDILTYENLLTIFKGENKINYSKPPDLEKNLQWYYIIPLIIITLSLIYVYSNKAVKKGRKKKGGKSRKRLRRRRR
tara:strand:- start:641 stop:1105 length:465 start_codon:yes stop_codon:yes gene_type:complete